jgi:hypothetical protein
MKRLLIVCGVIMAIAILVLAWMALDDLVGLPPGALTATRIVVTRRRMLQYAQSHNQLPHLLSELPILPGYDNDVIDEWGGVIAYEVSPSGLVTLTSLGRDGKIGGSGRDQDMATTFPSHDEQGRRRDPTMMQSCCLKMAAEPQALDDLKRNPAKENTAAGSL